MKKIFKKAIIRWLMPDVELVDFPSGKSVPLRFRAKFVLHDERDWEYFNRMYGHVKHEVILDIEKADPPAPKTKIVPKVSKPDPKTEGTKATASKKKVK